MTSSAPASWSAYHSGATSGWSECGPELKRGACQKARVHAVRWAARSARSHASSGEPGPQPPISPHTEFSATMCQPPRLKLYHPSPRSPARPLAAPAPLKKSK